MTLVCGLDGCRTGWFTVLHDLVSHQVDVTIVDSLEQLLARFPNTRIVAIDVPIGLADKGARDCDVMTRRLLGKRGRSVFPAPIRPVLAAGTHHEACEIGRRVNGVGMSLQSWAIVPKIREIDDALRSSEHLRRIVREVHPELCFYHLNGMQPLSHSKKTKEGRTERSSLITAVFGEAFSRVLSAKPRGCRPDDILDSFVAAWSAGRTMRGEAISVPSEPPLDRWGLPMQMLA